MHIIALVILKILLVILFSIITVGIILLAGYLYVKFWKYNHWRRTGLPYAPAKFPQGSFQYGGGGAQHVTKILMNLHEKFKKITPLYGTFTFFVPTLTLTSLDLTREILIKDFQNFQDRFANYVIKHDHLTKNLVRLEGDEWKNLRRKLTPTFTSGQMKYMFSTILSITEKASSLITDDSELKEFMVRYTTDVIGVCVFGLDCNSLEGGSDTFTEMGQKIIRVNRPKSFLLSRFPFLANLFHLTLFDQEASEFYTKVVYETIQARQQKDLHKKDFLDILIHEENLTVEEITAQLVVFYTAGMDNTSSILTFALIEMSKNREIQEKARENVKNCLNHQGFTYEAVMTMDYLDQVINETLRKYPPSPIITRNTTKDYKVPGLEYFTIKKGTRVVIPIYCFHHDEEFFKDPDTFNPSRFAGSVADMKAFMPFGEGPRQCLASRFGKLKIKTGLAMLLDKFEFSLSPRTVTPIELNPKVPMFHTKNGVYLNWKKI